MEYIFGNTFKNISIQKRGKLELNSINWLELFIFLMKHCLILVTNYAPNHNQSLGNWILSAL